MGDLTSDGPVQGSEEFCPGCPGLRLNWRKLICTGREASPCSTLASGTNLLIATCKLLRPFSVMASETKRLASCAEFFLIMLSAVSCSNFFCLACSLVGLPPLLPLVPPLLNLFPF